MEDRARRLLRSQNALSAGGAFCPDRGRTAARRSEELPIRAFTLFATVLCLRRRGSIRTGRHRRAASCGARIGRAHRRRAPGASRSHAPSARLAATGSLCDFSQGDFARGRSKYARDSAQATRNGAQGNQGGTDEPYRQIGRSVLRALRGQRAQARNTAATQTLLRSIAANLPGGERHPDDRRAWRKTGIQRVVLLLSR
jgi:hypothetical protein